MDNKPISEEYLNSFVDNQLDPAEKMHVFDIINQNESLKVRVCDLRSLKEIVKHAYGQPPGFSKVARNSPRLWTARLQPLAASILLLIGGMAGWLSHSWTVNERNQDVASVIQSTQRSDTLAAESRKIIIHVNNDNPMKFKAALDETESLLGSYQRAHQQIQLELIANQKGVNLLRSDISPYSARIATMQSKYPNLNFMVCGKTIRMLHNNGESVQLLPHTEIATSAADQINKRLHQGWGYIKI